jgi:hypothetical protein
MPTAVPEQAMRDAMKRHSADRRQVHLIAIQLIDKTRKAYEAYDADVDRWYRHRHINEGHAYPACIHGVSRYVDYDCACGPCENGEGYFDYLSAARVALYEAQVRWDNYWKAVDAYITMTVLHYDQEKAGKFHQWAHDTFLVVR